MTFEIPSDINNIPTNPDEIFAMLGEATDNTTVDDIDQDDEGEPTGKANEGQKAPDKATDKSQDEQRDQKMVPLSAVFEEREKNRTLRERAAALEARVKLMEEAQAAGTTAAEGGEVGFTTDELNEIEEAFPAMGKGFRALQSRLERMEVENRELKAEKTGRDRVAEEDAAAAQQRTVADAIAATPKLSHLDKTLAPEVWNARVAPIDDVLRADPEFKGKSPAERMAKIVEIYEYRYGPVAVADSKRNTETLQQRAADAVKAAGSPDISTLSDLPGGTVPEAPETDLERLSAHALASLPPDQLQRMIDRLA